MATAVETSSQPQAPSPPAGLLTASLVGAVYVLASIAVVLYAVPALWDQYVAANVAMNGMVEASLRITLKIAVIGVLAWFGMSLAGANPPKGLRGGIFLIVVLAAIIFLLVRWVGVSFEGMPGQVMTAIVAVALIFGAFKLVTSPRGERWMISLEEQGWFHAKAYKRVLGIRVRRLTMLGMLLLGGTGVYSLYNQGSLKSDWTVDIPFTQKDGAPEGTLKSFTLLTDARIALPLILMGLTLWIAYRAVNVPTFAEFLIATEAEMNKVSWTSRKRLGQDTIVVLITTILMALFLLIVDLFWGWLLSTSVVGVLPAKATDNKNKQVEAAKW
jgi:preprotein translocase SecE subunit